MLIKSGISKKVKSTFNDKILPYNIIEKHTHKKIPSVKAL